MRTQASIPRDGQFLDGMVPLIMSTRRRRPGPTWHGDRKKPCELENAGQTSSLCSKASAGVPGKTWPTLLPAEPIESIGASHLLYRVDH